MLCIARSRYMKLPRSMCECAGQAFIIGMIISPPGEGEGYNIISTLCIPAELAQHANDVERPERHYSCLA